MDAEVLWASLSLASCTNRADGRYNTSFWNGICLPWKFFIFTMYNSFFAGIFEVLEKVSNSPEFRTRIWSFLYCLPWVELAGTKANNFLLDCYQCWKSNSLGVNSRGKSFFIAWVKLTKNSFNSNTIFGPQVFPWLPTKTIVDCSENSTCY